MQIPQSVPDYGSENVADSTRLVWELRGLERVTCTIRSGRDGVTLQINHGGWCTAREHYPDAHAALGRA